jgi:F420-dependent oxidoreductase-like protein
MRMIARKTELEAILRSAKIAPVFDYPVLERFWQEADALGYHGVWNYDHFYGLQDLDQPTYEGWTTLAAMAKLVRRARIGCMVTGVTYRHPALLANMAVTVDHLSGGRLEFGIGAAWHEPEHTGYGYDFPSPGTRIAMLGEACQIVRRLWTEDRVTHEGRFWTLRDARCFPKPIQEHIPIVIGGSGPRRTLRVVAEYADEWNAPGLGMSVDAYRDLVKAFEDHCTDVGRDPSEVRRSVQLFILPENTEQVRGLPDEIEAFAAEGVEHVVLSFYSPPPSDLLAALAP